MSKLTMPLAAALMVAGALVLARGADAACGKVTIAEMTWASAGVAAHVEDIILKEGYGCDTEVVPGDTVLTVTSMTEKGEPDIAPEVWINSMREVVEAAVAEGRLTIAGEILSDGGEEGWWVPTYVVEQNPELTTLQEVIKRPDLFPDKEEPGKGASTAAPRAGGAGSSTATSTGPLVWTRPGSLCSTPARARGWRAPSPAPMNAATRSSRTTGRPTALLGNYPMVKLGGMEHDPATWPCIIDKDCADPQPNMYAKSVVITVVTSSFAESAPEAFEFVSNVSWSNSFLNGLLAWKDENQATTREAAEHFLKNNEDVWGAWVPAEVAAKVKAALM